MPSQIHANRNAPPWRMTVHGFGTLIRETPEWEGSETVDEPEVLAFRTRIVELFQATKWYQQSPETLGSIRRLVDDDLATAGDVDELNEAIDSIYDLADQERVWLEP